MSVVGLFSEANKYRPKGPTQTTRLQSVIASHQHKGDGKNINVTLNQIVSLWGFL